MPGTVVEGVTRRDLTVSFEAQDVRKKPSDVVTDLTVGLHKRMQKDRVECEAPLLKYGMRNLLSLSANDVCSSHYRQRVMGTYCLPFCFVSAYS